MPTKDDSFVALGPLKIKQPAFRTYGKNIYQGAVIEGIDVGVSAFCDKGEAAIRAKSRLCPAVVALSDAGQAIVAESKKADGMRGSTQADKKAGVKGTGTGNYSDGVHGVGGVTGYGGVFSAGGKESVAPQVRLVPGSRLLSTKKTMPAQPVQFDPKGVSGLPHLGQRGDLLTVVDKAGNVSLWLCAVENQGAFSAVWREVLLGSLVDGA